MTPRFGWRVHGDTIMLSYIGRFCLPLHAAGQMRGIEC